MLFRLSVAGGLALAACQWLIYAYAPLERTMGLPQKIFYLHLPAAWWAMVSFFVVCAAGIAYLTSRKRIWDNLAAAAAEVGVLLSTLALLTGAVWARHSWGVWWAWDPRLVTTLAMWFLYAGCLVFRQQDMAPERKAAVCATIGIVAFLDVPLVFFSARLWHSLHPAVFAAQGGGLEPEMRLTALACVLAFGLLWAGLLGLRAVQLRQTDRLAALETE